ncbi:MAG: nuclear transport factor 2 family protein [Kofleriaceae bacterium]
MQLAISALACSVLALACAARPPAPAPRGVEPDGPERAVETYYRASDGARSQLLRAAFHPTAHMMSVDRGALRSVTQLEWWQRLDALQAPEPADARSLTVLDREGPFALVEAVSRWPSRGFHDLMLVVDTGDGWRIVGKVFAELADPESPWRVLQVVARGSIAAAKLDVVYEGHRYIDHLLLVRLAEGWRIAAAAWGDPTYVPRPSR